MRNVVLVDMDNVIADFDKGFIYNYLKKFQKRSAIPISQRKSFFIKEDYPEKFHKDIDGIYNEIGFFKNLEPIEGAISALKEMIVNNYDVYICTMPLLTNPTSMEEKL